MRLLEVLDDGEGLADDASAVHQHRDQSVRIDGAKFRGVLGTGRCASHNDHALPAESRDDAWHVPHHLAHVQLLAQLVVELEPDSAVRYVSAVGGTNRARVSGMVEA